MVAEHAGASTPWQHHLLDMKSLAGQVIHRSLRPGNSLQIEKSHKENEQKSAASRVWAKLHGPAKAVVRHLDPDLYEGADGLTQVVDVLRKSPLQCLPVPDLFKHGIS